MNQPNIMNLNDLKINNTYLCMIDESMGGYSQGVLKLRVIEKDVNPKEIEYYDGSQCGYVKEMVTETSVDFYLEELLSDNEGSWEKDLGKRIILNQINKQNGEIWNSNMEFLEDTEENLTWIKENTNYWFFTDDLTVRKFVNEKFLSDNLSIYKKDISVIDINHIRTRDDDYRNYFGYDLNKWDKTMESFDFQPPHSLVKVWDNKDNEEDFTEFLLSNPKVDGDIKVEWVQLS